MSENKIYVVKKGDNLYNIALSQLGKGELWPEILKVNSWLEEKDRYNENTDYVLIKTGEKLIIPDLSVKYSKYKKHKNSFIDRVKNIFLG